jgi:hypothetical protein
MAVSNLGLSANELAALSDAQEVLETRAMQSSVMRLLTQDVPSDGATSESNLALLGGVLDQWMDSEEISRESWLLYDQARKGTASSVALEGLDALMETLLQARDRRILLLGDLMQIQQNLISVREQQFKSNVARALWRD